METITTDVLVIGGGSAAVRAASEAARAGVKVHLVDKGKVSESGSSPRALVGYSAVLTKGDTYEMYFQDWLEASGNICDQNLVWEAVTRGREAAEELEAIGIKFIRSEDGSWYLSKRAGHSMARTLMIKSEGPEHANSVIMYRAEAVKRGVSLHEGIMITRLFKKKDRVIGAFGINSKGETFTFSAGAVVLAAGGANRLYPNVADGIEVPKYRTTGDAFSLAFYAGAPLIDMEFSQFRDSPPAGALYGAKYLNSLGERFMEKYAPEALEKAPRYKVAQSVYRENMEGRGPVVWKVEEGQVANSRAPVGQEYADRKTVEIILQFQRLLGGARIDAKAATTVPGLFAVGESAGGVHGGDRLQGAGFLDVHVFGGIAGRNAAALAKETARVDIGASQLKDEQARLARAGGKLDPAEFSRTVQKTMWEDVGVVREGGKLKRAITKLEQLRKETALQLSAADKFASLEAVNLVLTAEMVARAGLAREETRSSQNRSDYPLTSDKWVKHVSIMSKAEDIKISTLPVVKR